MTAQKRPNTASSPLDSASVLEDLETAWRARASRPIPDYHHPRRHAFTDRLSGRFVEDSSLDKASLKRQKRRVAAGLGLRPGTGTLASGARGGLLSSRWANASSAPDLRGRSSAGRPNSTTRQQQKEDVARQIQSQQAWIERLECELRELARSKSRGGSKPGSRQQQQRPRRCNGKGTAASAASASISPVRKGAAAVAAASTHDAAADPAAAATKIQAQMRRRRAETALARRQEGATRIQALARGRKVRLQALPATAATEPLAAHDGAVSAATVIGTGSAAAAATSGEAACLAPIVRLSATGDGPGKRPRLPPTSRTSVTRERSGVPERLSAAREHADAAAAAAAAADPSTAAAAASAGHNRNRILTTQKDSRAMDEAALRIQGAARGMNVRRRIRQEKLLPVAAAAAPRRQKESQKCKQESAVAIQKVTRGARQRARMAEMRGCKAALFESLRHLRAVGAALATRHGQGPVELAPAARQTAAAGAAMDDRAAAIMGLMGMSGLARSPWGPFRAAFEALHELEAAVQLAQAAALDRSSRGSGSGGGDAREPAAEGIVTACLAVGAALEKLSELVGADPATVHRLQPPPSAWVVTGASGTGSGASASVTRSAHAAAASSGVNTGVDEPAASSAPATTAAAATTTSAASAFASVAVPLASLSIADVSCVLERHGLGAWAAAMAANAIDGVMLCDPQLSEQDLEEVGVASPRGRQQMLRLVDDLRRDGVVPAVAAVASAGSIAPTSVTAAAAAAGPGAAAAAAGPGAAAAAAGCGADAVGPSAEAAAPAAVTADKGAMVGGDGPAASTIAATATGGGPVAATPSAPPSPPSLMSAATLSFQFGGVEHKGKVMVAVGSWDVPDEPVKPAKKKKRKSITPTAPPPPPLEISSPVRKASVTKVVARSSGGEGSGGSSAGVPPGRADAAASDTDSSSDSEDDGDAKRGGGKGGGWADRSVGGASESSFGSAMYSTYSAPNGMPRPSVGEIMIPVRVTGGPPRRISLEAISFVGAGGAGGLTSAQAVERKPSMVEEISLSVLRPRRVTADQIRFVPAAASP